MPHRTQVGLRVQTLGNDDRSGGLRASLSSEVALERKSHPHMSGFGWSTIFVDPMKMSRDRSQTPLLYCCRFGRLPAFCVRPAHRNLRLAPSLLGVLAPRLGHPRPRVATVGFQSDCYGFLFSYSPPAKKEHMSGDETPRKEPQEAPASTSSRARAWSTASPESSNPSRSAQPPAK
jgi:hypothetical protein